jgi:hypothetical protein
MRERIVRIPLAVALVSVLAWHASFAFTAPRPPRVVGTAVTRIQSTRLHDSIDPFLSTEMAPKQRKKRLKSFTRSLEVVYNVYYGIALGPDGMPLEDTNIQGEVQQQLDVLCNTIILQSFCGCSKSIASVASEKDDESRSCADVMVCIVVCSSSCNILGVLMLAYFLLSRLHSTTIPFQSEITVYCNHGSDWR